jgi:hypothetical protein
MQIGPIRDSLVACRPIPDIVCAMILIDALKLIGGSNDGDMVMYIECVPSGRVRHVVPVSRETCSYLKSEIIITVP